MKGDRERLHEDILAWDGHLEEFAKLIDGNGIWEIAQFLFNEHGMQHSFHLFLTLECHLIRIEEIICFLQEVDVIDRVKPDRSI